MPFTVSGLSSGIDFSSLADALVQIASQPLGSLQDEQTKLNSKRDMYKEIMSSLTDVQTAAKALANPTGMSFAKATSGNEDNLTVSADSTAPAGTFKVTVQQLATATRVTSGFSGGQLGISASANLNALLNDPGSNLGGGFTGGYVTINGQQVAVNYDSSAPTDPAKNDTLQQVIDRINGTVTGVTASYDAANDTLKLSSANNITVGSPDDTSNLLKKLGLTTSPDVLDSGQHTRTTTHRLGRIDTSATLNSTSFGTALGASGKFSINGVDITWDASQDSLNTVINRINAQVSTVSASYDSQTDRIVLSSRETGSLGVTRNDASGNFLEALGLLDGKNSSQANVAMGQNAKVLVTGYNNDQPIYSTDNTVSNAIPGVTLTLKQADLDNPVTVTTTRDSSALKTKVQDFVTKYNAAMSLVTTRYNEEPLKNATTTTTQRVGLLRGDPMLASIRDRLQRLMTNVDEDLPADYNRLGNIGVATDKNNVGSGTLAFDTTKFDKAMTANFQQSYNVLFSDTNANGKVDDGEPGFMPKLLDQINKLVDTTNVTVNGRAVPKGTIAGRMKMLADQSADYDDRIETEQKRIDAYTVAIKAQMQAAQNQINALQQNLGSTLGNGSSGTLGYG